MKKTLVLIGVLLVLAWTSYVHANTVTLFQKSTTDANWSEFAEFLQDEGALQDSQVSTVVLAEIAFNVYKKRQGGERDFEAFANAWLGQHGLGARIDVNQFRALAQAGRFTTATSGGAQATAPLGFHNEVAFVAPAGHAATETTSRTPPPSTPTPSPTAPQTETASVSPQEVRALQSQLGQLRTEVGSLASSQQNDALEAQVAALEVQLSTLATNQEGFVSAEQFEALLAQVEIVTAGQTDLVTTRQLNDTVTGIQARLASLEASPFFSWNNQQIMIALAVAGGVVLLLFLLIGALWRRTRPQAASAQPIPKAPSTKTEESPIRLATQSGKAVPQQNRDIVLPENLQSKLQQLSSEQPSIQLPMMIDGKEYLLRFMHDSANPECVKIAGIESQTREVKIANIQSVLRRAAGQGRVRGLSEERQTA